MLQEFQLHTHVKSLVDSPKYASFCLIFAF